MDDYKDSAFYQEKLADMSRAERAERNALSFGPEAFDGYDDYDEAREVMDLAMDKNMSERAELWRDEARALEEAGEDASDAWAQYGRLLG